MAVTSINSKSSLAIGLARETVCGHSTGQMVPGFPRDDLVLLCFRRAEDVRLWRCQWEEKHPTIVVVR